ncbi:MAG: PEP/pyruvate-binding domain-containing protein [Desulfuromonadales bacterium]
MKTIQSSDQVVRSDISRVGGKARALGKLVRHGFAVPEFFCVTTSAYRRYLTASGLGDTISMELGRKEFEAMRWEELWDTALRIRGLFLSTPLPHALQDELLAGLAPLIDGPMVVRSSSPVEDSASFSFAGLHESVVNVRGREELLQALRTVWASLWSDRALLYRRELGLSIENSAMAVVVQRMLVGEVSGVLFTRSPFDENACLLEAVRGLNEGLVSGSVEPDRWRLRRNDGEVIDHEAGRSDLTTVAVAGGVSQKRLDKAGASKPLLGPEKLHALYDLGKRVEAIFSSPQDIEWTLSGGTVHPLQARPVTAARGDKRTWYLSLHRSYANLLALREKVEEVVSGMDAEAARLAEVEPGRLDAAALAGEIARRRSALEWWDEEYRRWCIPLAHGVRLFGQVYNDLFSPADPFEFVDLLRHGGMVAVERNNSLRELARSVRDSRALRQALENGWEAIDDRHFLEQRDLFLSRYDFEPGEKGQELLRHLLLQYAGGAARTVSDTDQKGREKRFLEAFPADRRAFARDLLSLARDSYRLRDNDNISLGKVLHQVQRGEDEARRRLESEDIPILCALEPFADRAFRSLSQPRIGPGSGENAKRARQLLGQPAGRGVASGPARVIGSKDDLPSFQRGEVLVCDAIDPTMTFVVPMAAAIVERRGGMLIHGAIIAREYGLPCVTGVPEAMELVQDGDLLTVDGYLGIVVVGR